MIEDTLESPDTEQRRALLDCMALAFRDNPMNLEIHPGNPAKRVRANRAGLCAVVLDTVDELQCRVVLSSGRVVGGWLAASPDWPVWASPSMRRQIGCFWNQGARAMGRWGRVQVELMGFRPLVPHWYLAVLGVEPSVQGHGFGGILLDRLIEHVEREDRGAKDPAPIYLECDKEESVRFYTTRGFRVLEETEIHGVKCWCLGRGFRPDV